MVKHTQAIRRQKTAKCLSLFDHYVRLAVKGLNTPLASKLMGSISSLVFITSKSLYRTGLI